MVEEPRTVIVNDDLAQTMRRDYCCAGCYGHLNAYAMPGRLTRLVCDRCGDGRGFVTKRWAERRKSDSLGEAMDVTINLRGILPNPHAGKSAEQLLAEIGV